MKKIILPILILALLTLTACSKTPPGTVSPAVTEITVVLDWTPNTNHTGLYVALEKGYFKEAGLDVKIVQPPEDGATTLVASGNAQFGVDFQDSLAPVFARAEPLPVTAIAALLQHNTSGIISGKDKNILSPKDLVGKKYATWDLPVEKAMIKHIMALESANFDDLTLIPSTVTDVITALQTDIDALWIFYGWDGIATEVAKLPSNFFAFKDIDPVFDYYTPVLVGNNQFMSDNPDITRAFLSACKKGYEYAISDAPGAVDMLLKHAPELDRELLLASQNWINNEYKSEQNIWGLIDASRWDGFYTWLSENELVDTAIPTGFGFSNDYLEK